MCQFIETICYEQGRFQRIDLHNERCNRTRGVFFGLQPPLRLELFLSIPAHLKDETVKCRITYGIDIVSIEYDLYKLKLVKSLQLVSDNMIDYSFKCADRTRLNSLFQLRGQSDDILIVKTILIIDSSCANIIFRKEKEWYSQQNPLLHGTRIESYMRDGRVTPTLLQPKDLPLFSEARLVNAMISIENSPVIMIENIKY